jgi:hypothetical protein
MRYRCKTAPVSSLIVTSSGFLTPLCEKCKSRDCSNPIEKKKMSILGITKNVRVYSKGDTSEFVINCQGYIE